MITNKNNNNNNMHLKQIVYFKNNENPLVDKIISRRTINNNPFEILALPASERAMNT